MASASLETPLQARSRQANTSDAVETPHSSSPAYMLPSSPLLKDAEPTPSRLHIPVNGSEVTSRASSIRLSRDLEHLRWDGEGLESDVYDDSLFGDESDAEAPATNGVSKDSGVEPETHRSEPEQLNTYSALSKRADFILASAKRKLSLLEGDIKGARHSLVSPTTSSYSPTTPITPSNSLRRAPLALGGDERKRLSQGPRINFGTPRSTLSPEADQAAKGHSRGFSDTSVPSPRGAAIRGSLGLEHVRQGSLQASMVDRSLGPVIEGKVSTDYTSPGSNGAVTGIENYTGLATPARVLRDEADDVRDRLSRLQQRLHQGTQSSARDSAIIKQIQALEKSLEQQEEVLGMLEQAEVVKQPIDRDPREEWHQVLERSDSHEEDYASSDEYNDEAEFQSVLEQQVLDEDDLDYDGAHEDRADAFDYEHFILHSVLGNYSLATAEERPSSAGSTSSNSTARGHADGNQVDHELEAEKRVRHNESVASFATAHSRTSEDSASDNEHSGPDLNEDEENQRPVRRSAGESRQPSTVFSDSSTTTPGAGSSSGSEHGGMIGHRPASKMFAAMMDPEMKSSRFAPLGEDDSQLVYSLAEAMRRACLELQRNAPQEEEEAGEWRARIEEARKILAKERDLTPL